MPVGATFVAAVLETALGEPPRAIHPVVWAGRYLDAVGSRLPACPPARSAVLGGAAWAAGAGTAAGAGMLVGHVVRRLPGPLGAVVGGTALWSVLSARMLLDEVAGVEGDLAADLDRGRASLARIVSRDTSVLDDAEVRAAALESLAENLSDSVVAPLFWYLVAGLPGAFTYRYANTADAMWGYRSDRWRFAGCVAARADDVANLVPARLTSVLLLAGAPRGAWRRLAPQARRTASPNAGWPMAALALRLDIRLSKPGAYLLHPAGRDPGPQDTAAALALARLVVLAAGTATAVAEHRARRRPARPEGDPPCRNRCPRTTARRRPVATCSRSSSSTPATGRGSPPPRSGR